MNGTILSDDIVELVSKLSNLQKEKERVQERIDALEDKLNLARDAQLSLINDEQECAHQLQNKGFIYGHYSTTPVVQPIQTVGNTSIDNTQLAMLLGQFINSQTSSTASSVSGTAPTSADFSIPPIKAVPNTDPFTSLLSDPYSNTIPTNVISPTSNGSVNSTSSSMRYRQAPTSAPTATPGLSIRGGRR